MSQLESFRYRCEHQEVPTERRLVIHSRIIFYMKISFIQRL